MTEGSAQPVFPSDFHEWCSADRILRVREESIEKRAPVNPFGSFFFIEQGIIPESECSKCLQALELYVKPRLRPIRAGIDSGWISAMQTNFSESFGKSMRVDSVILDGRDPEAMQAAEALGLFKMLGSAAFTGFAEAATGLRLSGGRGTQIIRYKAGDYVGPHNDHHPEYKWASDGYVDIQFMLSSPWVEAQYFLHERDGDFSQCWDISKSGGISVFRQPFWHQTTPLLAKPGHEKEAFRWLIGHVFAIRDKPRFSGSHTGLSLEKALPETAIDEKAVLAESRDATRLLERPSRIGQAPFWQKALEIYKVNPTSLWDRGGVPHRVTCSQWVADSYARAIEQIVGPHPKKKISVVELGVGSGKFTKKLLSTLSKNTSLSQRLTYVAHDYSALTLERLSINLANDSTIKIAEFSCIAGDITDQEIRASIKSKVVDGIVVFLANYFFDSLPFDIFNVTAHKLKLAHVDLNDRSAQKWEFVFSDVQDSESQSQLGNILRRVAKENTLSMVPFSVDSFDVLRSFSESVSEQTYWLIADKFLGGAAFGASGEVSIESHQTVSAPVFLPSILATLRALGYSTDMLFPDDPLALIVAGRSSQPYDPHKTSTSILTSLGHLSFVEVHQLLKSVEAQEAAGGLLRYALQMAHCDASAFMQLSAGLRKYAAERLSNRTKSALFADVDKVWQEAYDKLDYPDLCFEIGTVFHSMREPERAIHYYKKSLNLDGADVRTFCNLAGCYLKLDQIENARLMLSEAKKVDGSFPLVETISKQLQHREFQIG